MNFTSHYSSSAGNLYTVTAANGKRLMLECGVPWPKMQKALDHDFGGIEGCFVSHEHLDHCKAALDVMRNAMNIYASAGTIEALGLANSHRLRIVSDGSMIELPSFRVLAFDVVHNAAEPLGFVVFDRETREYLLFAVDTCLLTQVFPYPFSTIAIGCNYDKDILEANVKAEKINEQVARRLLTSHPASWWVKKYLTESVCADRLREVHVLHCSEGNLDKDKTRTEIAEALPFVTVL